MQYPYMYIHKIYMECPNVYWGATFAINVIYLHGVTYNGLQKELQCETPVIWLVAFLADEVSPLDIALTEDRLC